MTASIVLAAYYKRKITQTLPVTVMLTMIMFFLLGLTGRISHIVGAYLVCIIVADVVFGILLYRKRSSVSLTDSFDPGIVIWLILVLLLIPLYSHIEVLNWDDFHYWAIYPRNMFEINGAPNGPFACTEYKDYMRGVQFVYFFVFRIMGRFSESAMFVVNNALILTALMPFFERRDRKAPQYILSVIIGIMLPYLTMFQMIHCLGVDCIITMFFGYGLWAVYDDKKDLFYYVRIAAVMTALTVTKTAGLVFATVILAVFIIKERRKLIPIVCFLFPVSAFVLWKLYCIQKQNTTYLHEIFEKNVTGQNSIVIPNYAKSVTADFVKSFFTFRLNGGVLGLTPFVILGMFVAGYILVRKNTQKEDRRVFAVLMAGMVLYLLSVLYTYVFVFVEWEALSLSSYDRYVSNYMGAMLYLLAIMVLQKDLIPTKILIVVTCICALTINYGFIYSKLVPSAFEASSREDVARKSAMESQMQKLRESGISAGERVELVMPSGDADLMLYAQYAAVPVNISCFDASAEDADTKTLIAKASDDGAAYVYFTDGTTEGEFSRFDEEIPYIYDNIR